LIYFFILFFIVNNFQDIFKYNIYLTHPMDKKVTCDFIETPLGWYTIIYKEEVRRAMPENISPNYSEQIPFLTGLSNAIQVPAFKITWGYTFCAQYLDVEGFQLSDYESVRDNTVETIRKTHEEKQKTDLAGLDAQKKGLVSLLDNISLQNTSEQNKNYASQFENLLNRYISALDINSTNSYNHDSTLRNVSESLSRHVWDQFIRQQIKLPFNAYDGSYIGDGFCEIDGDLIRFYHYEKQTAVYDIVDRKVLPPMYKDMQRVRLSFQHKEGMLSQMR
jgi:hypothetical protein